MRRALVLAAIAGLVAGCGGEHGGSPAGPPEKDVRLTSCVLSRKLHAGLIHGVITNTAGRTAGYVVQVDILDGGGNPVDTALHAETKVAPGAKVRFSANGVQTYSGKITCRVASVQRTLH
ncbi:MULTISPECIES: FxLYD domain-containing protein [Actinoallomurus]|uniref:FxLYD domain-containing protein n=1 Tax=Actinoallomurus TaxID=667113 RepID=UPI0020900126|nr:MULTISPECIES: FxLYD domain-containing protein [Actinoallomurus]MCO5970734.1 FxLYD domain-containing protein [Actinoallomurus soli]MCO5993647.1 FxLYD domain-containing protein [Actinoallomurus rhizosphaericola]